MYTNPDLEDESRAMTLALDAYRSRSDFALVRIVDLRGDVPPGMRSLVRNQIRKEQAKELVRLKKAGVTPSGNPAPIIPDFSGLDAQRARLGQAFTTRSTSLSTIRTATRSSVWPTSPTPAR